MINFAIWLKKRKLRDSMVSLKKKFYFSILRKSSKNIIYLRGQKPTMY